LHRPRFIIAGPAQASPDFRSLPMNTKFLLTAVATLALSACATAPSRCRDSSAWSPRATRSPPSRSARRSVGAVASSKPSPARARPASR
jgi:hypothetical protein